MRSDREDGDSHHGVRPLLLRKVCRESMPWYVTDGLSVLPGVSRIISILEELLQPRKDARVMLLCDVAKILGLRLSYGIILRSDDEVDLLGIHDLSGNLRKNNVLMRLRNMSSLKRSRNCGDEETMRLNIRTRRKRGFRAVHRPSNVIIQD